MLPLVCLSSVHRLLDEEYFSYLSSTLVNNQAEPSLSLWLGLRLAVWAFWEAWIASLVILEAWLAVGLVACSFCSKKIAVVCTID
jgi:hypothetical protein